MDAKVSVLRGGGYVLVFLKLTDRCLRNPYESFRTSSLLFRYFGRDRLRSSRPASLKKAAELVDGQ